MVSVIRGNDNFDSLTGIADERVMVDVKASRSIGTTYQNATGYTIAAHIHGAGGTVQQSLNGSTWTTLSTIGQSGTSKAGLFMIIPDGTYYRWISGSNYDNWVEWRV